MTLFSFSVGKFIQHIEYGEVDLQLCLHSSRCLFSLCSLPWRPECPCTALSALTLKQADVCRDRAVGGKTRLPSSHIRPPCPEVKRPPGLFWTRLIYHPLPRQTHRIILVTVFDKNESSPLGRKHKQNPTDPRKQGDLVLAFF